MSLKKKKELENATDPRPSLLLLSDSGPSRPSCHMDLNPLMKQLLISHSFFPVLFQTVQYWYSVQSVFMFMVVYVVLLSFISSAHTFVILSFFCLVFYSYVFLHSLLLL